MKLRKILPALAGLLAASTCAAGDAPSWTSEGPRLDNDEVDLELPVQTIGSMLFVDVVIGAGTHRFLFDTGSPSMVSASLAAELGLPMIDERQSRDSHGTIVNTRVAQTDMTLGDTIFRKVPVFVAEFPKSAQCLFDGVLGSEVLPLCAWQIDLPGRALRCSSRVESLDHVGHAHSVPLHDFGYPHAPIMDIGLAKNARSKALFDTGSPEYMAISPMDFEGARRNAGVGRTLPGKGSLGRSIGGRAPDREQLLVQLKAMEVGGLPLGSVAGPLRESSPSLLGAAVLKRFVVTLDSQHGVAYFDQYRPWSFVPASYGFGLAFDGTPSVSLVWSGSPAAEAGLQVGDRVKEINGDAVDTSCDGIRRALRAMSDGDAIDIMGDAGTFHLERTTLPALQSSRHEGDEDREQESPTANRDGGN